MDKKGGFTPGCDGAERRQFKTHELLFQKISMEYFSIAVDHRELKPQKAKLWTRVGGTTVHCLSFTYLEMESSPFYSLLSSDERSSNIFIPSGLHCLPKPWVFLSVK